MVWVTSTENLEEETRGSANQRDGTPLTIIVSGSCFPLENPATKKQPNFIKPIT